MPNISGQRLRELEAAEQRLQDMSARLSVEWIGRALGDTFSIRLASTPFIEWSAAEKALLRQITASCATARWAYINLLPNSKALANAEVKTDRVC